MFGLFFLNPLVLTVCQLGVWSYLWSVFLNQPVCLFFSLACSPMFGLFFLNPTVLAVFQLGV